MIGSTGKEPIMAVHLIEALERRRLLNATGFSDTIDNPYMFLSPGMMWLYKGHKEGVPETDRLVVQSYKRQIKGVTCMVVLDRVYENGALVEKTHDFFVQDTKGNVWYMGEQSRDIENGHVVSTEGSWEHGVNGAKGGIIMEANPAVGDKYTQEHLAGVAEDEAEVLTLHAHARTPFGAFKNCLQTNETSPLEPDVTESKFYEKGVGWVKSQSTAGEVEVLKLVLFSG